MVPPTHLTIFVRCHQLVDLLIGPGSQDLNEALLIGADALGEEKGYMSQGLGWALGWNPVAARAMKPSAFRVLLLQLVSSNWEIDSSPPSACSMLCDLSLTNFIFRLALARQLGW